MKRTSSSGTGGSAGDAREFPFRHEPPPIPDHEVLRCIGKGSYGEVWMARSLTGALRAVKVVHRADFRFEKTFNREFEGIRTFEPISRNHPGLVHILHVGRNLDHNFYYYVMELADDRESGQDINPAEYTPHTLGIELAAGERLSLDDCIRHGVSIADALAYLHGQGLAHRDIKPSNVIFVNGEPKLADIGLVAASGQSTFVGTEGFVPPEGPGTPQADVYSLGMVLYEVSTGMDRMNFPELPESLGSPREREKWLAVNEVVCTACAPLAKKRYHTAEEMAADLREIARGERRAARFPTILSLPALSALTAAIIVTTKDPGSAHTILNPSVPDLPAPVAGGGVASLPPLVARAAVSVTSVPSGAEVQSAGRSLGYTPLSLDNLEPGDYRLTLKMEGYQDRAISLTLAPGERRTVEPAVLRRWTPPKIAEPWSNSLGMRFEPRGEEHVAVLPTLYEDFIQPAGTLVEGRVALHRWGSGRNDTDYVVFVPPDDAVAFCEWLEARDHRDGYLPDTFGYRYEEFANASDEGPPDPRDDFIAFKCVVYRKDFGDVRIESVPAGAEVLANGEVIGFTPQTFRGVEVGEVRYELRLPGFRLATVSGAVRKGETLTLSESLQATGAVVFGKQWENSQRMKMTPLSSMLPDVMIAIYETRRREYLRFTRETGHQPPPTPEFAQGGDHPIVNVSREDAEAYCRWLTDLERAEGLIEEGDTYRLPTDREWSIAAGIQLERGASPAERNERTFGVFPWGLEWPPPPGSGNFADRQFWREHKERGQPLTDAIRDYDDDTVYTAPVGRGKRNLLGLHDLAGNVWEWVEDPFGGSDPELQELGVVRGGSWRESDRESLRSSCRLALSPDEPRPDVGFRYVLERTTSGADPVPKVAEPGIIGDQEITAERQISPAPAPDRTDGTMPKGMEMPTPDPNGSD